MALETFTYYAAGVTFAAAKSMSAILNGHATEIFKIWRVGLLNTQTSAVTGVITQMDLVYRSATATCTGGTAITLAKHDSTNTLPTTGTYVYNGTVGGGTGYNLRKIFWSSDEPSISTASNDELQCFVPLNIIWDAGYGESTNVQPLTLRQNELVHVLNNTGAAGLVDIWIEFTKE